MPDRRSEGDEWIAATEFGVAGAGASSSRGLAELAGLDGAQVGHSEGGPVTLAAEVGAETALGARRVRAFLDARDLGRSMEPLLEATFRPAEPGVTPGWLAVQTYRGDLAMPGGSVELPESIDLEVVRVLGQLVPPGGRLLFGCDDAYRRMTARALGQGVPPAATPLGAAMFAAGCGVTVRDLADVRPRQLAGVRAFDSQHEARRGRETIATLQRFLDHGSADLDWDIQAKCRPLAEATLTVLRTHLGVLAPAFEAVIAAESILEEAATGRALDDRSDEEGEGKT